MKVLQINSFFSVGGPPRIVNGIYDTLKEEGHICKIAAARENMYIPEDSFLIGNKRKIIFNAMQARILDNEGMSSRKTTEKLIKQIEIYNPDVIQLHNLHGYYINLDTLFSYLKKAGKPVVWTLHDCWPMTGHCAHFDYIGCNKWKSNKGCEKCQQKSDYPSSMLFDFSHRNFEHKKKTFCGVPNMTLVTVSEWLRDIVKQSYLKEYPVEVIPNGLDLNIFKPTYEERTNELNGIKKKIVLGVAQNWGNKKGFSDMIRLSSYLSNDYQMVMVGLTDEQKRKLPNNIIGIQRTNSVKELAAYYTAASVFLNFSVEETMGLTTAEALACGTPAIVYNRTAVPEVVDDKCGWVVEPGAFDKVIDIIKRLKPKEYYATDCYKRASQFEKRKKYLEYIDLYKKCSKG